MNLSLLNPFRQADRIDSTLTIPRALHPPRPKSDAPQGQVGSGGGNNKSPSPTTTSTTKINSLGGGDGKKKKKSSSSEKASDGGGGSGFKIPKKQKLGNDGSSSNKLFRLSLKLSKLSAEGEEIGSMSTGDGGDKAEVEVATDATKSTGDFSANEEREATDAEANSRDDGEDAARKEGTAAPSPAGGGPATMAAAAADLLDDEDESENYWTACYAVSFNRRGSFLASGHASGLIPVHDFLGRTMSALYWPPPPITLGGPPPGAGGRGLQGVNNAGIELRSFERGGVDPSGGGGEGRSEGGKGEKDKKRGPKPKRKRRGKGGDDDDAAAAAAAGGATTSPPVKVSISSSDDLLVSHTVAGDAADEGGGDAAPPLHNPNGQQLYYVNGVTSLSWDRRSRTLLAGAIGDKNLRLMDNTHPLVSTDCTDAVRRQHLAEGWSKDSGARGDAAAPDGEGPLMLEERKAAIVARSPPVYTTLPAPPPLFPPYRAHKGAALPGSRRERDARITVRLETTSLGRARLLRSNVVSAGRRASRGGGSLSSSSSPPAPGGAAAPSSSQTLSRASLLSPISLSAPRPAHAGGTVPVPARRHPALLLELPQPLGGPVELHPRDGHAGLACMIDGSLALFYFPPMAFYETLHGKDDRSPQVGGDLHGAKAENAEEEKRGKYVANVLLHEERCRVGNLAYLVPPPVGDFDVHGTAVATSVRPSDPQYFITCAAFGKHGEVLWAVTKCGNLLAFRIDSAMMGVLRNDQNLKQGNDDANASSSAAAAAFANQMLRPTLCIKVPGGAAAWQIICNGKYILINSADCSLRLFDVEELSGAFDNGSAPGSTANNNVINETRYSDVKPHHVFQDNISKAPWASCDFSGDGEYVCGGCNSYPQPGDNYKLFLWNCITGELVDQLTGPVSSLYSLSCHPTRPFIAVGTSDGLIDVWGARLDWVAFAPDFQALQQNELYKEKEDEFDIVVDSDEVGAGGEVWEGAGGGSICRQLSPEHDDVDITTIDAPAFDSDSEDELDVFYFDTKVDKILCDPIIK